MVHQGGGLDRTEARGGGDIPVRREAGVGGDVGNDGLGACRNANSD